MQTVLDWEQLRVYYKNIIQGKGEFVMLLASGYAALAFFILSAIKYPLRKLGLNKANALMMKLHEAASGGVFLFGTIHMIMAFVKKKALPLLLSGLAVYLILFVLVAACHMTKDFKVKMKWHRILSLGTVIAIALHMVIYFVL